MADLNQVGRPGTRPAANRRLTVYVLGTLTVCVVAAIIGAAFFPAELRSDSGEVLRGDSGESEFGWLAGVGWAFGAFVLCVAVAVAYEVYLRYRGRRSETD